MVVLKTLYDGIYNRLTSRERILYRLFSDDWNSRSRVRLVSGDEHGYYRAKGTLNLFVDEMNEKYKR